MIAQLKKGVLEICILHLIAKNELYGYEIMKEVTAAFPDTNESTVYTILRRLLAEGSTQTYSKGESGGPPRKYYRITQAGIEQYEKGREAFLQVTSGLNRILDS